MEIRSSSPFQPNPMLNRDTNALKEQPNDGRGISGNKTQADLKDAFSDFVGQTFYGQMLASLRSTEGKVAYMNGGRGEEIFRGQLDQVIAEKLSDATATQIADPMFELFQLQKQY